MLLFLIFIDADLAFTRDTERFRDRRVEDAVDRLHFNEMVTCADRAELVETALLRALRYCLRIRFGQSAIRFAAIEIVLIPDTLRARRRHTPYRVRRM